MMKQNTSSKNVLFKFANCRTLKELYEEIVDIAQKTSNAERSVLFIEEYNEEQGKILRPVANRDFKTGIYTKESKSLTTYIWNRKRIDDLVEISNRQELSNFFKKTYNLSKNKGEHHALTYQSGGDFHSVIGTPLVFRGKCYGVLKVENKLDEINMPRKGGFTEEDKNMFQIIALSAALHISSLMEKDYIIDILNEVSQMKKREELYKTVVGLARKYSESESCSLFIVTPERDRLICKAAIGEHSRLVGEEYRLDHSTHSVTEYIFRIQYDEKRYKNNLVHISYGAGGKKEEERYFTNEAGYKVYNGLANFYKEAYEIEKKKGDFHELTYSGEGGFYNLIGTPLIVGGKCYGILKVENKKGIDAEYDQFSEYDMEIFMTIAICAALHISSYYEQYSNVTRISTNIIHDMLNKVGPIKDDIRKYSQKLNSRGDPLGEGLEDVLKQVQNLEKSMSRVGEVHKIRYHPLTIESIGVAIAHQKSEKQKIHSHCSLQYKPEILNYANWIVKRISYTVIEAIIENTLTNSLRYFWRKGKENNYIVKLLPIPSIDDNKLCIEISDNGEGIDRRYRDNYERIFEPLSSEDPRSGTGLGLWLVKEYVEEMGGTISVKSTHVSEDKMTSGTTIIIYLPIVEKIEKKRVILLENNLKTKASITEMLSPYYDVVSVSSTEDFSNNFNPKYFDAVLCDHRLPEEKRGADIIKKISEEGYSRTMILYSRYKIPGPERAGVDAIASSVNVIESSEPEVVCSILLEKFYEREF